MVLKLTSIVHLFHTYFFADDCLIFIKARNRDDRNLSSLIDQFNKFFGQAANFAKSAIAFSSKVPKNIKNAISNILQIRTMALQEKYLGVPLILQKNKCASFNPLLDNFRSRLALWKFIFLAQPGKAVLNQFVLGILASHHLSVFHVPKKLTIKMDKIQMKFWWGKQENENGFYPKIWDDISFPKESGGLNIRRTDILNRALLTNLSLEND